MLWLSDPSALIIYAYASYKDIGIVMLYLDILREDGFFLCY